MLSALAAFGLSMQGPKGSDLVSLELLSSATRVTPGKAFTVGIKLTPKPPWHLYWRNPGDSGQEIRVQWKLPKGWKAGPLQWPSPEVEISGGQVTYVYPAPTILLASITPTNVAGMISASVDSLICGPDMCLPSNKTAALKLAIGAEAVPEEVALAELSAAQRAIPKPWPGRASARWQLGGLALRLEGQKISGALKMRFAPYEQNIIANDTGQNAKIEGSTAEFVLRKSEYAGSSVAKRLKGDVLIDFGPDRAKEAYTVDAVIAQ